MLGTNIAGENVILGADYARDREKFIDETATRFKNTPVFDADVIPRGRTVHIGDGVWLKRCPSCDDYGLTYGTPYIMEIAKHIADHGNVVPGYNTPLL